MIFLKSKKIVTINIPPETLLFIKTKTNIKIGAVIAQLAEKDKQSKIEIKNLLSHLSGEISLSNNGNLIWLLIGQLFNTENNSYFNFTKKKTILKNAFISRTKILNTRSGFVKILENNLDYNNPIIQIFNNSTKFLIPKIKKFLNPINQSLYLFDIKNKKFILNYRIHYKDSYIKINPLANFAESFSNAYNTNSGGTPYFIDLSFEVPNSLSKQTTLLWVPEETHLVNRDISIALIENGEFITEKQELIPGVFSTSSGIVEIIEQNNIIYEILVKPGCLYKYKNFKQGIFYPGEIVLENLSISQISLVKRVNTCFGPKSFVRPLSLYQIANPAPFSRLLKNSFTIDGLFKFKTNQDRLFINKEKIRANKKITLFKENLQLGLINKSDILLNCRLNFLAKINLTNNFEFFIVENSYLNYYIPNQLKNSNHKTSLIIQKNQFINTSTILGYLETVAEVSTHLVKIKNRIESHNRLFLIRKEDCFRAPLTLDSTFLNKGANKNLKEQGKILLKTKTNFILQKGYPYRVSESDKLFCKNGDLIGINENIGFLSFEKEITADITQGLPRINEIFEARKNNKITELSLIKKTGLDFEYNFRKLGDFLKMGENMNLHILLELYFLYFNSIENIYEAAYRSSKKIEGIALNLIQSIYQSQGVRIADKHLEIIIRQMTAKVQICHKGDAPVFQNELIDLYQIKYINETLYQSKKTNSFLPTYFIRDN